MKSELLQLSDLVKNFCNERQWDPYHGPKDLAIGVVTEGSELLELFRFVDEKSASQVLNEPDFRQRTSDELADVFFFLLRFSEMYGFDLGACLKDKLKKNADKYPVEKFRGSNKKYDQD